ncbi:unnamed protein product, partial [Mesorhabditis spiculigera]
MELGSLFEVTGWDIVLIALLLVLVYRWWSRRENPELIPPSPPKLEPMPMQDMTLEDLSKYNGRDEPRILLSVNYSIYDVTRGANFYGPGGPYADLAGHDATRALAVMDPKAVSAEWDEHADFTPSQKDSANEWEDSFKYKYAKVGQLVKSEGDKKEYAGKMAGISA